MIEKPTFILNMPIFNQTFQYKVGYKQNWIYLIFYFSNKRGFNSTIHFFE